MSNINIRIVETGLQKYKAHLEKLNKSVSELEAPMREAGKRALALVRSYPPYTADWRKGQISFTDYKPGSKYKRTRNLQRHWKGQLRKGSKIVYQYRVYNYGTVDPRGREYGTFVQGDEQTPQHAGFWMSRTDMENLLREETIKVFEDFIKHIK